MFTLPVDDSRVVLLGGGTGCSRLAVPLSRLSGPRGLRIVVNTADDLWRYGLRICPDLDTNMYALAGWQDRSRGWGLQGDTFTTMAQVERLGEHAWFNLGDLDLATHLLRTGWLQEGRPLSEVSAELAARAGVETELIPMTDDEVSTVVDTPEGPLGFQEFFVQHAADVDVTGVRYQGIESASPAPGVIDAIKEADVVVIGPSSPVASVLPILELPGVREAVADASRVVAITPVVNGAPIVDEGEMRRARSRSALMAACGIEHTATGVARLYHGLADTFLLDVADAEEAEEISGLGFMVRTVQTLVTDHEAGDRLAREVLSC